MKKTIALILALVMAAAALAGCASTEKPAEKPAEASAVEEKKYEFTSEELMLKSGDKNVYGVICKPDTGKEKNPAIIMCHGFNTNADMLEGYAESAAKAGYVAYRFDFCGGAPSSRSDGATTEMSVLTEAEDLMNVIDQVKALDYVDENNLFVLGQSQGGFVAAYTAAKRQSDVKALILFFPAFVLQENARNGHENLDSIPETETMMGVEVGAIYTRDALSFDIYDVIGDYKGDVLICHGDKDTMVPLSYSEKALEKYDHAELKVIKYAEHGFQGKTAKEATGYVLDFLAAHVS